MLMKSCLLLFLHTGFALSLYPTWTAPKRLLLLQTSCTSLALTTASVYLLDLWFCFVSPHFKATRNHLVVFSPRYVAVISNTTCFKLLELLPSPVTPIPLSQSSSLLILSLQCFSLHPSSL